jgi:DNA-binding NarL/FixJ family response regulator
MSEPKGSACIRVVVVDDHPIFRRGLLGALEDAADVDVVGWAGNGDDALAVIADTAAQVVLLDLNLPGLNGIEVASRLTAQGFDGAVLILTMYEDEAAVMAALGAGARGYLLKGAMQDEILAGIRAVASGGMVLGSAAASAVASRLSGASPSRPGKELGLTEREAEILSLMADGRRNTEIARTLFLSEKTVRNHITSIFTKLGVTDRAAAVTRAREHGLRVGGRDLPWEAS